MGIIDEREIEASHERLASSISAETEVLKTSIALICKALKHQEQFHSRQPKRADYLAISVLGYRIVNDICAATRLLDCGYFVQAAALLRDLAELGILALYFTEKPEELSNWREAEGKGRYAKFGTPTLRRQISDKDRLARLDEYFSLHSEYGTHPSAVSIFGNVDEDKRLVAGPFVNNKTYLDTYKQLSVLSWHVTDACGGAYRSIFHMEVSDLFPTEFQHFVDAWYQMQSSESAHQ